MKGEVSKARKQKTKDRQKQADRDARLPFHKGPGVGFLLGLALWVCTLFLVGLDRIPLGEFQASVALPLMGKAAFLFLALFGTALFLKIASPEVLDRNGRLLLLAILSLASLLLSKASLHLCGMVGMLCEDLDMVLLPIALAPLLATILVGGIAGLAVGVWTTLATSMLMDMSFPVIMCGLVATVMAVRTCSGARKRSQVFRAGLLAGVAQISCVFAVTALNWESRDIMQVVYQAGACVATGVLASILTVLTLPLFETCFDITTDITLLELSDLGHPLLQRLAMEAPGTYHHSLVVASLAQAAADEIGANSLLTRVCSYYHDIGKLTKPDFFAENIHMQVNPHDDLPPSMSTLVITAHVKEGLTLALLHKLPEPIQRVIVEHHGTSLISCFHHKARTQLEFELGKKTSGTNGSSAKVDESDFRYSGPKPSTKESAIISLADSVEAASRSLEKTTPGHLESLVNEIVFVKLKDEQLENCDLTMEELARIKRSFVFTLTNMLHGRIAYPKDEDRAKQPARPASGGPEKGHPSP